MTGTDTTAAGNTAPSAGTRVDSPPVQDYYPRCMVYLTVRLEEYGAGASLAAEVPQKTTRNLQGTTPGRAPLHAVVDPTTGKDVTRYLLLPVGESPGPVVGPQQRARSSDKLTYDFAVVPREATWRLNGIYRGDTLGFRLKWSDVPFDPRLVRSAAVTCLMGTVSADQNALEAEQGGQGVLPEAWVDANGVQRSNVRFLGWADSWEVDFPDDGEPSISVECCDNVRLLLAQMLPPRLGLSPTKRLDLAVADYLSQFPQLAGMTVEHQPAGDPPPLLKDVMSETALHPRVGPTTSMHGGAGGTKFTVWDYLNGIVLRTGRSIYVDGTRIIIQRLRSLTTSSTTRRSDDPFRGRVVAGAAFNYRTFILGENCRRLGLKRDLARHAPVNVEVTSYDSRNKVPIKVVFPPPGNPQAAGQGGGALGNTAKVDRSTGGVISALPGSRTAEQKWITKSFPGITDKKVLRALGQEIYEAVNRSELQVTVRTSQLASYGGGNDDPDVLDVRYGDTYEVLVRQSDDEESTVTALQSSSDAHARNVALMQALGFSDELANAYADQYTNAGFTTLFRVREMEVAWRGADGDAGLVVTLHGQNYIEARADKLLPNGEEPPNTANAPG